MSTRLFRRLFFLPALVGIPLAVLLTTVAAFYQTYSASDGLTISADRWVGADFITFYVGGILFRDNPLELYDFILQRKLQFELFSSVDVVPGALPFIYPPFIAAGFSLLSSFKLLPAFLYWTAFSFALFLFSIWTFAQALSLRWIEREGLYLFCLGFFPFIAECLGGGQTSAIGVFVVALFFIFLKKGWDLPAGIVLALGAYKPPLFLLMAFWLVFEKRWWAVVGGVIGGSGVFAFTWKLVGLEGIQVYLAQASRYTYGVELIPGHTLAVEKGVGLFALLRFWFGDNMTPARALFAIIAILLLFLAVFLGRRVASLELRFAVATSLSLFLSVWMMLYDLTILLVPIGVLYSLKTPRVNLLLWVAAYGMLAEFVFRDWAVFSFLPNPASFFFCCWIAGLYLELYRRGEPSLPPSSSHV